MRRLKVDRLISNAAAVPLVAVGYAACAYSLRGVGCMPQFIDGEFFGEPVVQFLLAALTLAALTLVVFAALAAMRQLLAARRLRRSVDAAARVRRWSQATIALSAAALAIIAVLGASLLTASCE